VPRGLRLAYCADLAGIGIDPDIERVCRDAAWGLQEIGATVETIDLNLSEARRAFLALRGLWFVNQMFPRLDQQHRFGVNVANNVKSGLEGSMRDLGAAEGVRGRLWHQFRELFDRFDHLLTPCMAVRPFPVEQNYPEAIAGKPMTTYVDWLAPTFLLSMTGLPVASVPCGLDAGMPAMPVGLQIVGGPLGEERVLALAAEVQRRHPLGRPALLRWL
jgi:amidase